MGGRTPVAWSVAAAVDEDEEEPVALPVVASAGRVESRTLPVAAAVALRPGALVRAATDDDDEEPAAASCGAAVREEEKAMSVAKGRGRRRERLGEGGGAKCACLVWAAVALRSLPFMPALARASRADANTASYSGFVATQWCLPRPLSILPQSSQKRVTSLYIWS